MDGRIHFGGVEPFGEDALLERSSEGVPADRMIAAHAGVRVRRFGSASGPLIIVSGGISSGRFFAGPEGWWSDLVGYGLAVDLHRFNVVGFDFAPLTPTEPPASTED